MIIKLKYFLITFFSITLFSGVQCMEENPNREDILNVVNQHSEQIDGLTRQLGEVINNVTNLVNFTNTLVPIGAIIEYGGTAALPNNWLECNGDDIRQDLYNELFQVIHNTYGPTGVINVNGNMFPAFKLPDRRGRVAVGIGSDNSTGGRITDATAPTIQLGKVFGEETHQLTIPEMPEHGHKIFHNSTNGNKGTASAEIGHLYFGGVQENHPLDTTAQTGQDHNNMQPSIFMKFYIRAK